MSLSCMSWAIDKKLPPVHKFVLLMMADSTDHDFGAYRLDYEYLSDVCCITIEEAKKIVKELDEQGVVTICRMRDPMDDSQWMIGCILNTAEEVF